MENPNMNSIGYFELLRHWHRGLKLTSKQVIHLLLFLKLLSQYDWTFSPLVVDINNDLSQSDVKEVNELKRLVAYARSSADLLNKLTFQEEIGPYRWEDETTYDTKFEIKYYISLFSKYFWVPDSILSPPRRSTP
ncbi:unnamed protein product [Lupinus luteus]|uniref:Nrap protein domain-containing protein n=1 Tax=Lupinus luteus TaxID=3873 RepID=A0AAV1X1M2_LUPLU